MMTESSEQFAMPAPTGRHQWIIDTGSEQGLVGADRTVTLCRKIILASDPISLSTAKNCSIVAEKIADFPIEQLCEVVTPYVLPSTPAVLSVGQRCLDQGYDFVWRKSNAPCFARPDGEVHTFHHLM